MSRLGAERLCFTATAHCLGRKQSLVGRDDIITNMPNASDLGWLDSRIKERAEERNRKRIQNRDPSTPMIDASKFSSQLAKLAKTLINSVEREGSHRIPQSPVPLDTGIILRQLVLTYNLILFLNADERRYDDTDYQQPYSFVILPLVRTMIDGFYNCTALLDDPRRSRVFRISGLYRIRESIRADQARHGQDSRFQQYLAAKRATLELGMRTEGFTDADLDNRKNKWPLLGTYLDQAPDTPHKRMLREFTLGFWKEYSSISHATYDGLVSIFPFIAVDKLNVKQLNSLSDVGERQIAMHVGRTAAILLCLLTEVQHFYKFHGPARIDERLAEIWTAVLPFFEAKELYQSRYRGLLRKPEQ